MSRKIMTVDDSASVRKMISFTLKQHGYEVVEAVNGTEALRKLKQERSTCWSRISTCRSLMALTW